MDDRQLVTWIDKKENIKPNNKQEEKEIRFNLE
jgi:hypothetical protein